MYLKDYVDMDLVHTHIFNGNLASRGFRYKYLHYVILNYTPKVQFKNLWDDTLLKCRGLVYTLADNSGGSVVVARPFPKFFNLSELSTPPSGKFRVFDKLDGALGIGIEGIPGYITTRGSPLSDQAEAAREIWARKYSKVTWPSGFTPLWEIVHPVTKVVVKYDFEEDLVLLAMINIETGKCHYPTDKPNLCGWWPGPTVTEFDIDDLSYLPKRNNAEGFVVVFENGTRVKIKYDEYIKLHKIYSNFSPKLILEWVKEDTFHHNVEQLPNELYKEAVEIDKKIQSRLSLFYTEINLMYRKAVLGAADKSRKQFALEVLASFPEFKTELFLIYDRKMAGLRAAILNKIEKELLQELL